MWRFTMALLCLIAALAGSPLRQAEAAGDLARSLAELHGGDVIEGIDGGVGDDAGETILRSGGRDCSDAAPDSPAIDGSPCPAVLQPTTLAPGGDGTRVPRTNRSPAEHPARRHAWLQTFRF
jgi:hypothetical protein